MKLCSFLLLWLVGTVPLALYFWLSGGEFSLLLGIFFLTGALAIILVAERYSRGRFLLISLSAGILFPWLVKGIVFLVIAIFGDEGDYGFILFDTDFFMILPLYYILSLFFLASRAYPHLAPYLLSSLFLVMGGGILFYKSLFGKIDLAYSLPGALLFLLLGTLYLMQFRSARFFHRRSARRRIEGLTLLLILFLAGGSFLLRTYEEKSIAEGGGLLQNDLFQFDFSDVLTLQPEIAMTDELVMLFRKEGEAQRLLIRRFILDRYEEERGFFREGEPDAVPAGGITFEDPGYEKRTDVLQEYYLINMNPSVALGLNYPVEIIPYKKWEGASFQRVLQTTSRVDNGHWWELFSVRGIDMEGEERELYTDYGGREDIAALARDVASLSDTPVGRVKAVEAYLKQNYYYSLKPGISSYGDQLGYFLFVSKKGYCSYFAFAMTLMLRSLDIPARVVVGFWVDPKAEVLNFYPVLANQAHAWVEVYFNERGWIEFDPTSENMAEGENFQFGRVDYEQYGRLIEEIVHHEDELVPEVADPRQVMVKESLKRAAARLGKAKNKILMLLSFAYLLWTGLSRRLPLVTGRSGADKRVIAAYVILRKELFRSGYFGRREETPWDYALRMEEQASLSLREVTRLYLKGEFAEFLTREDLRLFENALVDYRNSRRHIPLFRRIAAVFYPLPQTRRYL